MKPIIISSIALYLLCSILVIVFMPKSVIFRFLYKRAFNEIFEDEEKAEKAITLELKDSALQYAFILLYNLLFSFTFCLNPTIYGGIIKQKERMMYNDIIEAKDKILEKYRDI